MSQQRHVDESSMSPSYPADVCACAFKTFFDKPLVVSTVDWLVQDDSSGRIASQHTSDHVVHFRVSFERLLHAHVP